MLKWIASGCLVIIVVVGIVVYAGYRKMKSIAAAGPSVTVAIHSTPDRVFASMAHSDSLTAWFSPGSTIRTARQGQLAMGDTVFVTSPRDSVARTGWVIDTLVPSTVVAMHWISLPNRMLIARRRDSLATAGDSTMVTSTVSSFIGDTLAAVRARANGVTAGVLDMTSAMGIAGIRMQAEMELKRLKAHIEGRPVSPP